MKAGKARKKHRFIWKIFNNKHWQYTEKIRHKKSLWD